MYQMNRFQQDEKGTLLCFGMHKGSYLDEVPVTIALFAAVRSTSSRRERRAPACAGCAGRKQEGKEPCFGSEERHE